MSYGFKIRNNAGGLLVSDTSINRQLIGPVSASEVNWGSDPYAYANWCTHVANIAPRAGIPMVFLKLPTSAGKGVALSGIIKQANGSFNIYILAAGFTIGADVPQFYYTDDYQGVVAPAFGMVIRDPAGQIVWSSNVALPSADVVPWFTGQTVSMSASRYATGQSYSIAATFRPGLGPVGMFPAYSECGASRYVFNDYSTEWSHTAGVSLYRADLVNGLVIAEPAVWEEDGMSAGNQDYLFSNGCQIIGSSYDMYVPPQWYANAGMQDREFLLLR